MIVRAAVAVTNALGRIGAHPAATGRMIQVVAETGPQDARIFRFCETCEDVQHVFLGGILPCQSWLSRTDAQSSEADRPNCSWRVLSSVRLLSLSGCTSQ